MHSGTNFRISGKTSSKKRRATACIDRNIACVHVIRVKTFLVKAAGEITIARLETVEVAKYHDNAWSSLVSLNELSAGKIFLIYMYKSGTKRQIYF